MYSRKNEFEITGAKIKMSDLSENLKIHNRRINVIMYRLEKALDSNGKVTLSSTEVESIYHSLNPKDSYNYTETF